MVLNEEQQMIREMAHRFAAERIRPFSRSWEVDASMPADILAEMGELGFLGMTVPENQGGAGLDYVSYVLALMEIAAGDGALSTIMSVNNAPVCEILLNHGSPDQQERFLAPLARGEMIGAFALSEPQAGTDAANLRTRAERDGDRYRINGTKQFITSGRIAGAVIVFAVTDPAKGKKGITAFVVPRDTAGMSVTRIEEKLGQTASDTAQLDFADAEVDVALRIGAEGEGYRIALSNLETGRIGIAAQSVGMAQAALDAAVRYTDERESFGTKLRGHQAVAFRLADMTTELEVARAAVLRAAALKDAGHPCLKEACIAKLFASEAAERICSSALQCLGGYGYTKDFPVEKIYRDVRVCQIYEGTSDVQRMLIAKSLGSGG